MVLASNRSLRFRLVVLGSVVVGMTVVMWTIAGVYYRAQRGLLAASGVAYTLGLRHALDADHISAIDNVTRKLMTDGRYSTTVGFFFSIGHSSLVIAGCFVLWATERAIEDAATNYMTVLTYVSSVFASVFLILIGLINLVQLIKVKRELQRIKREKVYREVDDQAFKGVGGVFTRCAGGIFKSVDRSWKMFFVGLIFGLGFDTTASVTAVMTTATSRMSDRRISFVDALIISMLFTCGMVAMDTADGIMMLGTYKWSDRKIVRRLFFTYIITLISVIAALVIGVIIGLRLIVDASDCTENNFCKFISFIDAQFQFIGLGLTLCFIAVWGGGYLYYRHSHWSLLEDQIVYASETCASSQALVADGYTPTYSCTPKSQSSLQLTQYGQVTQYTEVVTEWP
ncbi:high-affinity nickel-transport protein [Gregarina niphandrodes]|uniref:Nickel/cobalt efflux system n=1 Tax=Gregarina niphandrodes TaxID=110365 RepID=A0A023B6H1_GRENI|nr:high-affinity nickel-transport protein [Gregarina niphandrodes]EZG66545.1 high-affinity nickel-transport protein [Gregarina niphandrodes]|eukprot:XP_011130615.1 high-affinity nickel-transport protein [Gregarina niphandrodes]